MTIEEKSAPLPGKTGLAFLRNRTVLLVCLISFFTDAAGEMLYPILPVYLNQIGFSVLAIGLLEGVAETVCAFLRGYSGTISDHLRRRNILIQIGYTISAFAKPALALTAWTPAVFFFRTLDRFGKGLRGAPRDALLIDLSDKSNRSAIFGLHRAADTAGAVLGPLIALALLGIFSLSLHQIILLSVFPGLLAAAATLLLPKEPKRERVSAGPRPGLHAMLKFWKSAPREYKQLVLGFALFGCINSSDLFIFLKHSEAAVSTTTIVLIYCLYNLVYSLFSLPAGLLADKYGAGKIFVAGLIAFVAAYSIFAISTSGLTMLIGMMIYGVFSAATDGIAKSWLSEYVPKNFEATGMGLYQSILSLTFLVASPLTAIVWQRFGSAAAFTMIACGALGVAWYLFTVQREMKS